MNMLKLIVFGAHKAPPLLLILLPTSVRRSDVPEYIKSRVMDA